MPTPLDTGAKLPEWLSDIGTLMEGKLARDDDGRWIVIDDKGYKRSVNEALLRFEGQEVRVTVANILRIKEETETLLKNVDIQNRLRIKE